MKKMIFIAIAAFMLSSCVRDNFITNYVEPLVWEDDFRILRSEWQWAEDELGNPYFRARRRVNQLNMEVFTYGQMQAFFITARGALAPLPFSEFFEENGVRWGEHFTIAFEHRYITFIMRSDDLASVLPVRPFYEFNVRFLW